MRLKADLHLHTSNDTQETIGYSPKDLVDRATRVGLDVLSITEHDTVFNDKKVLRYARDKGILLIPGVEKTIEKKHVLLINVDRRAEKIQTFDQLRNMKANDWLVVAPHPFFPKRSCLHWKLMRNIDLFDAVEYSFFYHDKLNFFNKRAVRVAEKNGLAVVGTSDCHHLADLGRTYSLIDAEKSAGSIVKAVKEARVEVVSNPLSLSYISLRGLRSIVGY